MSRAGVSALAVAALALAACGKSPVGLPEWAVPKVQLAFVAAGSRGTGTKVGGNYSEREGQVHNLQVVVFDSNGNPEAFGKADAASLVLEVSPGVKDVFCFVNAPPLEAGALGSAESLLGVRSLLSANDPGALVMWARSSIEARAGSTDPVVQRVGKVAARVRFTGLVNASSAPLSLLGLWAQNVAGDCTFGGAGPSLWHNCMGHSDAALDPLLFDSLSLTLQPAEEYSAEHAFYVFPNPVVQDCFGGPWRPRCTRLVLMARFDGQTCYYPVSIPGPVESGHSYNLGKLAIRRQGVSGPDKQLDFTQLLFDPGAAPGLWEVESMDASFSGATSIVMFNPSGVEGFVPGGASYELQAAGSRIILFGGGSLIAGWESSTVDLQLRD